MPYTMDNMPEMMKGAPKHAMEIFIAAFNSAFEKSHVEGAAMAIAMSAVHKAGYKKDDTGNWMSPAGGGTGGGNHSEWISVFKSGTHTDSAGNVRTWTEADLDTIVSKYNPADHEAPEVIGHPEHDAPAWGWVEALKREGQTLYATMKGRVPEFVEMIKKGLFKKRSISLYPDLTLRHVGWLGAMPPAVKGLPNVQYAEKQSINIEFGDIGSGNPKSEIQITRKEAKRMKWFDWLKGKATAEGVTIEDAPQSFSEGKPKSEIDPRLITEEVAKQVKVKELEFSEAKRTLDAEKEALKVEKAALEKSKADKTKADIASFCEGLCKEGKLTPAMMKQGIGMQNFLERISEIQTSIEFSEGDEKKTQTPFEYMKGFLSSFKRQIEFGEFAGNEKDIGKMGSAGEKLEALTQQKMKDKEELSYNCAFSEVQKENRDLALEYAQEIAR